MEYDFGRDFIWGSATAAYQIEGAYNKDGKGESVWDRFTHSSGNIQNNDNGDKACDHYDRFEEDITLMKEIGLKYYRFSISWPRVLPDGFGTINEKGIAFYRKLIDVLKANGITPAVTLYHWDLPQNLQDLGGWVNPQISEYFEGYARLLFKEFGEDVPIWITLNEPWVFTIMGYGTGQHAPGLKDMSAALKAAHNSLVAHGRVVKAYREMGLTGEIGITLNMNYNYPYSNNESDIMAAEMAHQHLGRWFADPVLKGYYPKEMMEHYKAQGLMPDFNPRELKIINQPIDFLGINYYTSSHIRFSKDNANNPVERVKMSYPVTEMGWEIIPKGLEDLLLRLHRDYAGIKIYITENGAAFVDKVDDEGRVKDVKRQNYLQKHFEAMHSAIQKGVNLKGYFLWSLMDNFEWAYGYTKRFGIIYVDYITQRRMIKDSGKWYGRVIKEGKMITDDVI